MCRRGIGFDLDCRGRMIARDEEGRMEVLYSRVCGIGHGNAVIAFRRVPVKRHPGGEISTVSDFERRRAVLQPFEKVMSEKSYRLHYRLLVLHVLVF
jgi:hypothetical protein